ncbi:MAG: N-acetyl sugar amidotransferase [Rhodospirillaceae bacterium]|jgi:N-acetyl sugar amidotransferase|nr:N-acetyl sugar amidotransferase [Rhodospirillaceae bacterium]
MRFCNNCLMPDTRPDLEFDEQNICDACVMAQRKLAQIDNPIDWDARRVEFEGYIRDFRTSDPTAYDCIIPVSGGKDSTYQVHIMKNIYGLKPLCLCFEPTLPTEIGRHNLNQLNRMGVDLIHVKRNPLVYETLILESFRRVGDMEWPNHAAIWSLPYRYAVAFNIPLIIWGEGRMEYAGTLFTSDKHMRSMDEEWATDYGVLNGLRPEDFLSEETGLTAHDMSMYTFPPKERLAQVGGNRGCTGLFLGYFFNWDVRRQLEEIEKLGWQRSSSRIEGAYGDYENLDCLSMNLHDHLKYCKFGYGRATDQATRDIRHGDMTREEGLRLAERYDGEYPKSAVAAFCEHFKMTASEFEKICDDFTNPAIFEMSGGRFVRDADRGLVMKPEIIEARRNP